MGRSLPIRLSTKYSKGAKRALTKIKVSFIIAFCIDLFLSKNI